MEELTQGQARRIIDIIAQSGVPPDFGLETFSAGLDVPLRVLEEEYLASYVKQGGSAFKMPVGEYGGGKTHFMYCVRDIAWRHDFVVSYVELKSGESPFHQLELVYKAIVNNLMPPLALDELFAGYEKGIMSFLRRYYMGVRRRHEDQGLTGKALQRAVRQELDTIRATESVSFSNAMKNALVALDKNRDGEFLEICQWLKVEGYQARVHREHGILQRINKNTAFQMIRSLVQFVRSLGFSGLVILLDEAERSPSLSTRQKDQHLSNLREIIDACGHAAFKGIMIFYAVPNENIFEGERGVYEALKQRIASVFKHVNPSGVKILLEVPDRIPFLVTVGQKLCGVYQRAYDVAIPDPARDQIVQMIAEDADDKRFGDEGYKRLFVTNLIKGFHFYRFEKTRPSLQDLDL